MGQKIAKILYGSQNYNLSTPESDKDYKVIEFPTSEELFYEKRLNRQIDDNSSVWDVRNFFKYLSKANPNALELLFSVEQEYYDEDFKELLDYIRPRIGSVIRKNWQHFSSAMLGLAWESLRRNLITPKTVGRLVFFYLMWLSLVYVDGDLRCTNGEMTEETWRNSMRIWPRELRELDDTETSARTELEETVEWISRGWVPSNWYVVIQPQDDEVCLDIQEKILNYFNKRLTSK